MTTGNQQGARAYINMTPLIDVLLVLLIIFMVVSPTTSVGLEALIPQPSPEANVPDRTVVVRIDRNLAITINSEPTGVAELGERLSGIFKARAEKALFLKAHPDIEFQHVAKAIDIAKGAGLEKIGLLGDKPL